MTHDIKTLLAVADLVNQECAAWNHIDPAKQALNGVYNKILELLSQARGEALTELVQLSEELGLYDDLKAPNSAPSSVAKLDPAARDAFERGWPAAVVEVLVHVVGPIKAVQPQLEQAGLKVHTIVGPIATGSIHINKLLLLADISSVRRVELNRPLYTEYNRCPPDTKE